MQCSEHLLSSCYKLQPSAQLETLNKRLLLGEQQQVASSDRVELLLASLPFFARVTLLPYSRTIERDSLKH